MRAVYSKNGLYCLVIDDGLKYELCERVYAFLQKMMKIGQKEQKISPIQNPFSLLYFKASLF